MQRKTGEEKTGAEEPFTFVVDDAVSRPEKLVIFDGACGFCSKSVLFILKRNRQGDLFFSPSESNFGKQQLLVYGLGEVSGETLIFIDMGIAYTHSDAGLRISKYLRFPWNFFSMFLIIPKALRDPFYKFIARNRYRLIKQADNCIARSEQISGRFIED